MTNRGDGTSTPRVAGRFATLAFAAGTAAGCVSTFAFAGEKEIPACAMRLREAEDVPCRVRRVEVGDPGHPLRVEVEERGTGERERLFVLVHGALSDRRTWRYMVGPLGAENDLLLVDLPGCGGSDLPRPADIEPDGYGPDVLARAVLRAVRADLARRPVPPRVTLVGHSVGSAVVLRALGSPDLAGEFADVLDRVDGAVLFSPLDFTFAFRVPTFERVLRLSPLEVAVGNVLGLVRGRVSESIFHGAGDPEGTPSEEVDRVCEILSDSARLRAAQAMIRSSIPFTPDLRPDWPRIERFEADYARVRVPCLLVSGGRDDAVPEALGFKLLEQLPRAYLRVLPRAGHGVPTERPVEGARLVAEFAASRGRGWAAYESGARGSMAVVPSPVSAEVRTLTVADR